MGSQHPVPALPDAMTQTRQRLHGLQTRVADEEDETETGQKVKTALFLFSRIGGLALPSHFSPPIDLVHLVASKLRERHFPPSLLLFDTQGQDDLKPVFESPVSRPSAFSLLFAGQRPFLFSFCLSS